MRQIHSLGTICWIMLVHFCYIIPQESLLCVQPDFLTAMNCWQGYVKFDDHAALKDSYMAIAIQNYNDFWMSGAHYNSEPLIPKIIHQIWLGSSLPEKYKRFQQSWKKYHPDWTYILWSEKEIEEFGLKNKKIYDKTKNLGQKSDIARYEILYRIIVTPIVKTTFHKKFENYYRTLKGV